MSTISERGLVGHSFVLDSAVGLKSLTDLSLEGSLDHFFQSFYTFVWKINDYIRSAICFAGGCT